MGVDELLPYLRSHGEELRQSIADGSYKPNPVRRVEIPKDNGKTRPLGIPTVVDRVIQQAISQVLTPVFEKKFSENSYGFRPNRNAHQAILLMNFLLLDYKKITARPRKNPAVSVKYKYVTTYTFT